MANSGTTGIDGEAEEDQEAAEEMINPRPNECWERDCRNKTKHRLTVRDHSYSFRYNEDEAPTYEVDVCGVHRNVLERGSSISVRMGGTLTAVKGQKSDINVAREALEQAENDVRAATRNTNSLISKLGPVIMELGDETLSRVFAYDPALTPVWNALLAIERSKLKAAETTQKAVEASKRLDELTKEDA